VESLDFESLGIAATLRMKAVLWYPHMLA